MFENTYLCRGTPFPALENPFWSLPTDKSTSCVVWPSIMWRQAYSQRATAPVPFLPMLTRRSIASSAVPFGVLCGYHFLLRGAST